MSLVETIKQISVEAVKANKPVEFARGTIASVSPITVKIDQRLILNENNIDFGSCNSSIFSVGDWVTLLRIQGGKKYFLLDSCRGGGGSGSFHFTYNENTENITLGG